MPGEKKREGGWGRERDREKNLIMGYINAKYEIIYNSLVFSFIMVWIFYNIPFWNP